MVVEEEVAAEGSCHLFAEVKMGGFEVVMARGGRWARWGVGVEISASHIWFCVWNFAVVRFRLRRVCVSVRTHTFPADWQP